MNPRSEVIIFTDGSSRGNPGPGGYAAIIVWENNDSGSSKLEFRSSKNIQITEIGGREERTTNNRMELQAAVSALSYIQDSIFKILLHTDSAYVVNGITKWVYSWERRNWVTMDKKPVLNKDLWEDLLKVSRNKKIDWKLVGGHVGIAGNVRCDEIATAFADNFPPSLYSGPLSEYGVKNILDIKYDEGEAKEKSASRAHSKAVAYSYISKVDGKIETHKTWAECERRVKGKPAKYKKVLNSAEESALIKEWGNA